jgi:hypothetical protein
MPEIHAPTSTPEQKRLDRQLLLSLMLPVAAAGINTIVGFTVAHWITITGSKRTGYLVALASFALCLIAALLAAGAQRKLGQGDESQPEHGRQLFMARLGLLLSGLSTLLVIAGTLVLVTLRPND